MPEGYRSMTQSLRDRYEELDLTPGKGRGSAALSIALGLLSFCQIGSKGTQESGN